MQVRTHDSAEEFRSMAGPVYRRDPIGFTVELAGLAAPALPADAVLLTAWDAGRVVGAAVQTPPYPLACGGLPNGAVAPAVDALADRTPRLTATRGPLEVATRFAAAWTQRTGAAVAGRTEERLHALDRLEAPTVPGEHRTHRASDTELLADWSGRFFVEAFGVAPRPIADHRAFVTAQTRAGARFVLWLRDDRPVSMAMLRPTVAGVARIGPVYTPDADRGHGYGSAVTAAAASIALAGGAGDVVLFTDLANPVSNAIYRRIGFRPVGDWLAIEFTTRR